MTIQIASGTGTGPTKLAAYDTALNAMGVANYNIIRLTSIIPPGSKVVDNKGSITDEPGTWGDKLYVVIADTRVNTPNAEAWSGIGWVQDKKSGKGLFVEHESTNEKTLRRDIQASLEALIATRNGIDFGDIHMKVTGITCVNEPVCALAIAVYQASSWSSPKRKIPGLPKF